MKSWRYGIGKLIGSMKFKIDYVDKLEPRIPSNSLFTLITGTPIIVRIP